MIKEIDFSDMRFFLENSLLEYKNDILLKNKYCTDDTSYLTCTFLFIRQSVKDGLINYLIILFEDLPKPYPAIILNKIEEYLKGKSFQYEYVTWSSYESYVDAYSI